MGYLATNDYVGISFWIATAIMLASTVFFFVERQDVSGKWRTSLTVAGLVLPLHERDVVRYGSFAYGI